ncbi:lipocalin-like domain-containing protein [Heminiphilus faecis]|uniref:Lipocalin-like domain-containing protein n=1 Tax=Heminiphilus faecis TaxID=2601703 RepID=A0ABV4CWX2_9BACT
MKYLNRYTVFAVFLTAIVLMTGCRKRSINGDLDGQWQIMKITLADGTVENPEQYYYCLYLHTVNLTNVKGAMITGNMEYGGNTLTLKFPTNEASSMLRWGIDAKETTFEVKHLSHSGMTLHSDYATIEFRKF